MSAIASGIDQPLGQQRQARIPSQHQLATRRRARARQLIATHA
jgi:hypothetical protein